MDSPRSETAANLPATPSGASEVLDPSLPMSSSQSLAIRRSFRPWVTLVLIAANVFVALVPAIPGGPQDDAVASALAQDRTAVWAGEYWRLLTGIFAHAGFAHLALNMIALALLGRALERVMGHTRFAALYGLSGLSGALSFQAFSAGKIGLGASGAVYGAFGFLLAVRCACGHFRSRRRAVTFFLWTLLVFGLDQLVTLLADAISGIQVSSSAHLGGYVAGSVLAIAWLPSIAPWVSIPRFMPAVAKVVAVLIPISLAAFSVAFPPAAAEREALRAARELESSLVRGDFEEAARVWRKLRPNDPLSYLNAGYLIFDGLMANGQREAAEAFLERLMDAGLEISKRTPPGHPERPDINNTVAWILAFGRSADRLEAARQLAEEALAALRPKSRGLSRFFAQVFGDPHRLGAFLNTRGWIEFRLAHEFGAGDLLMALRELETAAKLSPTGPQFLYLGWVYARVGRILEAREAARQAEKLGGLSAYEKVLREELEASLR